MFPLGISRCVRLGRFAVEFHRYPRGHRRPFAAYRTREQDGTIRAVVYRDRYLLSFHYRPEGWRQSGLDSYERLMTALVNARPGEQGAEFESAWDEMEAAEGVRD